MLKEWQFNILFFVGVGGAVFLLIGPEFGLDIASNPTALAGVGSILTYILTQKKSLTKSIPNKVKKALGAEKVEEEDDSEEEQERTPRKSTERREQEEVGGEE